MVLRLSLVKPLLAALVKFLMDPQLDDKPVTVLGGIEDLLEVGEETKVV